MEFAVILTINVVVIVLGIIVNMVISFVMLREKKDIKLKEWFPFFIMHLAVVELLYCLLTFNYNHNRNCMEIL